ncbi:crossover junction endodeoxyribonuclease RuvC [Candidatus Dependentiae bacterium]|nr:crossover junction endodeoxyribonuclease RuvC [Candidatus Dependentiae bacterium]
MSHAITSQKVSVPTEIVLGVDPGFSVTGFALVAKAQRITVLDCGYLKMSAQKTLSQRTGEFYAFFQQKIIEHKVTHIALETSFLGKNAQTFLKLGFLRGVLFLLADQHHLVLTEFAPREVKLAVTGSGAASKDQVADMMMRLFPALSTLPQVERADATDALAVALCGLWNQQSYMQGIK